MAADSLTELRDLLTSRAETLQGLAIKARSNTVESARLMGKVDGVRLALSFIGEVVDEPADAALLVLSGRLDAVGHLHHPQIADLLNADCATDNCVCEGECPTHRTAVCAECNRIAMEAAGDEPGAAVLWPCPTALAFGVKPTQGARR